jgi:hypothetical protein
MSNPPSAPVIVTLREVERVLRTSESTVLEAADQGVEAAQAMAAMGAILKELRKAEREAGSATVLITAQHGPSSRLQSLIASGEAASLHFEPLPGGGLEAKFDTHDWAGWARVAWAKIKNPIKHALLKPHRSEPSPFANSGRIAVIGDWAPASMARRRSRRPLPRTSNLTRCSFILGTSITLARSRR